MFAARTALLSLLLLALQDASAQSTSSGVTSSSSARPASSINLASASTVTDPSAAVPTGPYQTYSTQILASTLRTSMSASNHSGNATVTSRTSSNTLLIAGTNTPSRAGNATGTATRTSATPTNTQACNNYPEFCSRKYMNVTEVCSHNSAFAIKNNAASNQELPIITQLDDGIRMIQGETHWVNDTIYSCHTSCDILNAGTLQNELSTVASWVAEHPYDVVTILLVNSDYRNISDYVAPIQNSGLAPYLYEPPKIPMHRDDWPTYGEMILSAKRVVIFMDYNANQTEVPYVLDEFSQMWETPFSPTDASFPCTQQRPPGLNEVQQDLVPYLANHNLNYQISIAGLELLIPAYGNLSQINAVSGHASAGQMMNSCLSTWDRPPAFLLVDYYNRGNWNGRNDTGAVFEVAAQLNGVTYNRPCCGTTSIAANVRVNMNSLTAVLVILAALVLF